MINPTKTCLMQLSAENWVCGESGCACRLDSFLWKTLIWESTSDCWRQMLQQCKGRWGIRLKEGCVLNHVQRQKDCDCINFFSSEISLGPKKIILGFEDEWLFNCVRCWVHDLLSLLKRGWKMTSLFFTGAYAWMIPTNRGFRSCLQS